ncbi:RHS repeat-associated core domain-containing protein, partial [Streptomyces minutiscleroticus]|uniref:RHS repeat-associated core domain-containing protein n=1 Tax=Streptomyces minutiscleroticus TaxID=68238 RepID=UPI00167DBE66
RDAGTPRDLDRRLPHLPPRHTHTDTNLTKPYYRFAGNYQDPTGLYHLQARYYDANIGRFTQPDPSGQEQNPYLYAEGDPVNRIDPSGLLSFGDVTGIGDWASLTYDTLTGDTEGANATKMGVLAGAGFESLCLAGAAAGSFATLGVSVGAGLTGCSVVAAGVAGATTAAYS